METSTQTERAWTERQRAKWLAREEIIYKYLKSSDIMVSSAFGGMRVIFPAGVVVFLLVAWVEKNPAYLLINLPFLALRFLFVKRAHETEYGAACKEVEAVIEVVRQGGYPPEYTPETQKQREPLLGDVGGQFAFIAAVLFFCIVLCVGMGISMAMMLLTMSGADFVFWLFSPVYLLLIGIGLMLAPICFLYVKFAWGTYKLKYM